MSESETKPGCFAPNRGQHFWRQRADGIFARLHIEHQVEPQNSEQWHQPRRRCAWQSSREFLFGQKITIRAYRREHGILNHLVSFNPANSTPGKHRPIGWLRRGRKVTPLRQSRCAQQHKS